MTSFFSSPCSTWTVLLISAVISAAYALEFVVRPSDETVAPNSLARFECVVRGRYAWIHWLVDDETYKNGNSMPKGHNATWYSNSSTSSSTLEIMTTGTTDNYTSIRCRAGHDDFYKDSRIVYLKIAGRPLRPDGLEVSYKKYSGVLVMEWKEPFTHLPQFPILSYQAQLQYLAADQSTLKRQTVIIEGAEAKFSLVMNESELCSSSRVCVRLRARNGIGYSQETETTCTNIEREHSPLPVNATLSVQSDGRTLVSVVFQVPPCFPQAMQSTVVVQEALPLDTELTPDPPLMEEGAHLMESYALTAMQQDVVYSVTVQLKSHSENTSSLPVFVTLPPQATTGSGDNEGGIIAGIVLAVLAVTALATTLAILAIVRGRRKDTTVVNQMQPNPLYENSYYDSIPDSYSLPPVRSPSYDSHIYQDMPELVCRLHGAGNLPPPPGHSCVSDSIEDMKRVQTVVAEAVGEGERESEYITMHSVTEVAPALQTDV